MITLQALCAHLDDLYQPALFKDYCPNGLQVEGSSEVKKVATAVTANLDTIKEAARLGVDCLICHHGLFWGSGSQVVVGALKEKIQTLLDNGISLAAYHLPMDAHSTCGNNFNAAHDLGFTDVKALEGTVGVVARAPDLPKEAFKDKLEGYYGHPAHCAEKGPELISRVGILSGGGWRFMEDAAKEGVDAFITGSYDEPAWTMATDLGVNFYALGHSATERVGPKHLATHLKSAFSLPVDFIDVFNPF
jgi:dinuclear metal center YbgI/SA1388 family protein